MLILTAPDSVMQTAPSAPQIHIETPESKLNVPILLIPQHIVNSLSWHICGWAIVLILVFEWSILPLISLPLYNYVYIVDILFIQQRIIESWP